MSDVDHYPVGLSWPQFCKKYAKNNQLTYSQAMIDGKQSYYTYKSMESQYHQQQQETARQPTVQAPAPRQKSKRARGKEEAPAALAAPAAPAYYYPPPAPAAKKKKAKRDKEYERYLAWKAATGYPKPPASDSSDSEDEY